MKVFARLLGAALVAGAVLWGETASAQPIPQAVISPDPVRPFIGENFSFSVNFDNTAAIGSNQVGYNALLELLIPAEVTLNPTLSSPVLGSISPTVSVVVPLSGVVVNTITGEMLSGLTPGMTYYLYELPLGSMPPEQPSVDLDFTASVAATQLPNIAITPNIIAAASFGLGADPLLNPATDPVVRNAIAGVVVSPTPSTQGAADTADVIPVLYIPYKTSSVIDGNGTATGPNFPILYTLSADIAEPATINSFNLHDAIPDAMRFTGITDIQVNPSSGDPNVTVTFQRYDCGGPEPVVTLFGPAPLSTIVYPLVHPDGTADLTQPPNDVPGGCLNVTFSALSGEVGADDVSVTYEAYIPEFDATGVRILPETSGGDVPVANDVTGSGATATGPFGTLDLLGSDITSDPTTVVGKSLDTQKSVALAVDNNAAGTTPGDIARFTISGQISDYFGHDQLAVHDLLGDGLDFGILNPGNATLTLSRENGQTLASVPLSFTAVDVDPAPDRTIPGQEYPFPVAGGETLLVTQNAKPGEASGTSPGFTTLVFDLSRFVGNRCSSTAIPCADDADCPGVETCVLSGDMSGGFVDLVSYATGFRAGIDDDTRFTITFDATIQEFYENPASYTQDASIDCGDSVDNSETVAGHITSVLGGQIDADSSDAALTIAAPTVEKFLVAVNGSDVLPSPVRVLPGDDVTYLLRTTIPVGDLEILILDDFLPIPVFSTDDPDADGTPSAWSFDNTVLAVGSYPAAGVAAFGSGTTVNPPDYVPTDNPPTISIDAPGNSVEFHFPDKVTFQPTTPQPIVVEVLFTVRVTTDPFADELFLTNFAQATFGNSNDRATNAAVVRFVLREPNLQITKGVSATSGAGTISPSPATLPVDGNLTGADAGDLVTYVITVENQGGSPAYDVTVTDPEVTGHDPGSCTLVSVTSGDGVTPLPYTGDIAAGVHLTNPLDGNDGTHGAPYSTDTALLTVQCTLADDVQPSSSVVNLGTVTRFNNDGGINFVDPGDPSAYQDDAVVTMAPPTLLKTVSSVAPQAAGPGNVAAGDVITYALTVTLPEGRTDSLVLTDSLPAGFEFLAPVTVDTTGFVGAVTGTPATSVGGTPATGETVTMNFGTVDVTADNDAASNDFVVVLQARVRGDLAQNSAPISAQNKTNNSTLDYDSNPGGPLTSSAATSFREAVLTITKSMAPNGADAGDTITFTLTVSNTGTAPAYDVAVSDLLDLTVFDGTPIVSVNEGTTPAGFTYAYDGAGNVSYTLGAGLSIPAGSSRVFTFTALLRADVVTGSTYSNTADVDGDSQDGTVTSERATSDDDTANLALKVSGLSKVLAQTSEPTTDPGDGNLAGNPPVLIGEVVDYRVTFTIPEGVTRMVRLADVLPTGISHLAATATLARSSAALTAANNVGSGLGINGEAAGTLVPITLSGTTGTILIDLGNVTNSDTDNLTAETYTLRLKAVIQNTAANQAGTLLRNRGRILYRTATGSTDLQVNSSFVNVHVAESIPAVNKTALPATGHAGDVITFQAVISNIASGANGASGFDWTFTDTLPAEYINAVVVGVNTAAAPGAAAAASFGVFPFQNVLSGTIDQLDAGESITVTYQAQIDVTAQFGQTVVNTMSIRETSLPGPNGTGAANPNAAGTTDGERTGTGGVNDLFTSDNAPVAIDRPTISKTLVGPQSYYAIGQRATFQISVGVPAGTSTLFTVRDNMPADLELVPGTIAVATFPGFSAANAPLTEANTPTFYSRSGDQLAFEFGTITATVAGTVTITYDAVVEDVLANQDGRLLRNNVTLEYTNPSAPPATLTIGPVSNDRDVRIGEPNLTISKAITSGAVGSDAGDTIGWQIAIANSGHTTAYRMAWNDVLPDGPGMDDGLGQISGVNILVSGGNVYLNGTTTTVQTSDAVVSTTTNVSDTISLPSLQIEPGATITISFNSIVGAGVTPGQVLNNLTAATYNSLVAGVGRDASSDPTVDDDDNADLDNYRESASQGLTLDSPIAIDKSVARPTYAIGEDAVFSVRVDVFEGVTQTVLVTDELPPGLTYRSHSIAGGNMGVSFSNPGYNVPTIGVGGGGGQTITFDFGDITDVPNLSVLDDFVTIDIVARIDNILANQNTTALENNTWLTYGPGATRLDFDTDAGAPGIQGLTVTVIEPDLTITKTVVPSSQSLGDVVTFSVTVAHSGTSTADAFDMVVTDTIPAGLTYVPGSVNPPAGASFTDPVLTVTHASLTQADGSFTFTYEASIDPGAVVGTPLFNDADLVWASIPGATGAPDNGRTGSGGVNDYNDTDNESVTPTIAAYLEAVKTVTLLIDADASTTVTPGDTLRYNVTLRGESGTANNIVFADTVPADTTYVAASLTTDVGVADDSAAPDLVVTIPTMTVGNIANIRFDVTVDPGTPTGTILSNQGVIDSDETVPEPTDQDDTDSNGDQPTTIPVGGPSPPAQPLRADKIVGLWIDADASASVTGGDTLRYTIVLRNLGASALTGVTLNDAIPAGLTGVLGSGIVSGAGASIVLTTTTVSVTVPSIAAGDFEVARFEVTIDGPPLYDGSGDGDPLRETFINQGTADSNQTPPVLTDSDGDPTDGEQPTSIGAVDGVAGAPVIDLEKRVTLAVDNDGDGLVDPLDVLEYVLTLRNSGTAEALNTVITDPTPNDTTVVAGSATSSRGIVVSEAPLAVNLGNVPAGGFALIRLRVTVDAGTPSGTIIVNQATADGDNFAPEPSDDNGDDGDGKNPNRTPVDTGPPGGGGPGQPSFDKALTATSEAHTAGASLAIGEVATFQLAATVPPGSTRQITLSDTLPAGLAYIAGSARLQRIFDTGLNGSANPGGINGAASGTFVALADGSDVVVAGQTISVYLGDVINSDAAPNDESYVLEYRVLALNDVSNQAGTVLDNLGTLTYWDGLSQTRTLTDTQSLEVFEPQTTITKTAVPDSVAAAGGSVTFTINVTNPAGPSTLTAFEVSVNDTVPASFTGVSAVGVVAGGGVSGVVNASAGNAISVTAAVFPAGGTLTLTFTANIAPPFATPSIDNTATATWTSLPGNNGSGSATPGASGASNGERNGSGGVNDYATDDVQTIVTPVLFLAKSDNPDPVTPGAPLTYTLLVTNTATSALTNVEVVETYDPRTTFVSASPAPSVGDNRWVIGTLGAGAQTTISITVDVSGAVAEGDSLLNSATVTADGGATATEDENTAVTVHGSGNALLDLNKSVSPAQVPAGGVLHYTLVVSNAGPATSYATTVDDVLPSSLTYMNAAPTPTTVAGNLLSWDIGDLGAGASTTIEVFARAGSGLIAGTLIDNCATAQGDDGPGTTANAGLHAEGCAANTSSGPGGGSDLDLVKSHSGVFETCGEGLYTLRVNNLGPDASGDVITVTDVLPAGVTYLSASGSGWTCAATGQIVTCGTTGVIAAGESSPTIALSVAIGESAYPTVNNTASVSSLNDPNPVNDTTTHGTTVRAGSCTPTPPPGSCPVSLKKVHSGNANPDGQIQYTLQWSNACKSDLTDVTITDPLPQGLQVLSATSSDASVTISDNTVTFHVAVFNAHTTGKGFITAHVDAEAAPGTEIKNVVTLSDGSGNLATATNFFRIRGGSAGASRISCFVRAQVYVQPGRYVKYEVRYKNGSDSNELSLRLPDEVAIDRIYPEPDWRQGNSLYWGTLARTSGKVTINTVVSLTAQDQTLLTGSAVLDDGAGNVAVCETVSEVARYEKLFASLKAQSHARPGREIRYTGRYREAVGANQMTVALPKEVTVVSATPTPSTTVGNTLIWNNLPLPAGVVKVDAVVSSVADGTVLVGSLTMTDETTDVVVSEAQTSVGSASATDVGGGQLTLSLSALRSANAGVTTDVSARYAGMQPSGSVTVVLPPQMSPVLAVPAAQISGNTVQWPGLSAVGGSMKLRVEIDAAAPSGSTLIIDGSATDASGASATAQAKTSIKQDGNPPAALSMTLTLPKTVTKGSTADIYAKYDGLQNIGDLMLTLPAGLTLERATPDSAQSVGNTVVWRGLGGSSGSLKARVLVSVGVASGTPLAVGGTLRDSNGTTAVAAGSTSVR